LFGVQPTFVYEPWPSDIATFQKELRDRIAGAVKQATSLAFQTRYREWKSEAMQ
jgi:hypothetical protein